MYSYVIGYFKASNGEAHAMVMVGYYDITVKYQKNKSSKAVTKTTRYYVVNDGWYNCDSGDLRIAYINSKYLKNGITILK